MSRRDPFPTADVAITLTGEQWFAILARFNEFITANIEGRKPVVLDAQFSRKGRKAYDIGMQSIQNQLLSGQMKAQSKAPAADADPPVEIGDASPLDT